MKRVFSYPVAEGAQNVAAKPRRHEQTQSQHDSVETSPDYSLSSEVEQRDPSDTSVNSREPLLSTSNTVMT